MVLRVQRSGANLILWGGDRQGRVSRPVVEQINPDSCVFALPIGASLSQTETVRDGKGPAQCQ